MNYNQMELVERKLLDAGSDVAEFIGDESRYFLRNLETVQGDEADYIILGLTYGKGEGGRFSAASLGPITKNGGHRRLNVASSRSRMGMTVVSSLIEPDLAGSSATSEGFRCFRDFLAYLQRASAARDYGLTQRGFGSESTPEHVLLACESPFEEEVASFLGSKGLELKPQFGSGRYRIDIVVCERGKNILAVECDGAAYHSTVTARTRDRARQRHLESRGWRFHRIWSRNWFRNPEAEQAKLMEAIKLARESKGTPVPA